MEEPALLRLKMFFLCLRYFPCGNLNIPFSQLVINSLLDYTKITDQTVPSRKQRKQKANTKGKNKHF